MAVSTIFNKKRSHGCIQVYNGPTDKIFVKSNENFTRDMQMTRK